MNPTSKPNTPHLKSGELTHLVQKMPCPKCKKELEIVIYATEIVNRECISMVLLEHNGEIMCACGTIFIPVLMSIQQAMFGIGEVPKGKERHLVQVPQTSSIRPS